MFKVLWIVKQEGKTINNKKWVKGKRDHACCMLFIQTFTLCRNVIVDLRLEVLHIYTKPYINSTIFNFNIKDSFVQREHFAIHEFLFSGERGILCYPFHGKSKIQNPPSSKITSFFSISACAVPNKETMGCKKKLKQFSSLYCEILLSHKRILKVCLCETFSIRNKNGFKRRIPSFSLFHVNIYCNFHFERQKMFSLIFVESKFKLKSKPCKSCTRKKHISQ